MTNAITLDSVGSDTSIKVMSVSHADSALYERLNSLGIVSGAELKVLQVSPFGGPIAVKVLGSTVSMRRSEAKHIFVHSI